MNFESKIDLAARLVPGLVCIAISIVYFVEVYDITMNPAYYINTYGIEATDDEWQYKSVSNFRLHSLAFGLLSTLIAVWCFYIYSRESTKSSD